MIPSEHLSSDSSEEPNGREHMIVKVA